VIRIGDTTVVGRIASLADNLKAADTPLTRELDAFIRIIAVLACAVAGTLAIVSFALGHPPLATTIFFVGVLVSLVPEGLMVICFIIIFARGRFISQIFHCNR
jgi:sodium/potassium-transporting ATPase subunit alpha